MSGNISKRRAWRMSRGICGTVLLEDKIYKMLLKYNLRYVGEAMSRGKNLIFIR